MITREEFRLLVESAADSYSSNKSTRVAKVMQAFEDSLIALREKDALERNLTAQINEKIDLKARVQELEQENLTLRNRAVFQQPLPSQPMPYYVPAPGDYPHLPKVWNEANPSAPFHHPFEGGTLGVRAVTANERDDRRNQMDRDTPEIHDDLTGTH